MDLVGKREEYVRLLSTSLEEAGDKLSRLSNVRRVSIFGSSARGKADLFTDFDILVINQYSSPSP